MRIALITAVYGGTDVIKPYRVQNINNYEAFCFTDTPKEHIADAEEYTGGRMFENWRVIDWKPPMRGVHHRRKNCLRAKYIKCQTHRIASKIGKFDAFIWVDGSVLITGEDFLQSLLKKMKRGFVVYRHPWRRCAYAEARRGMEIRKYDNENISGQVQYYKKYGFPQNEGLYMNTLFARKNEQRINDVMDLWWDHNMRFSTKDQVSLPYAFWRKNFRPDVIDSDPYVAAQFEKCRHTARHDLKRKDSKKHPPKREEGITK